MKFIAYYRVSTEKQGKSGLGLEAQRESVLKHVEQEGGTLIAEYSDVISGASEAREQLDAALRRCEREKATLIISKLDRLARQLSFLAKFIESKVPLVVAELPHANKMLLQMMAVFAEAERDMVSQRTKDALAAAKKRGVVLGNPKLADARVNAAKAREQQADEFALQHYDNLRRMKANGHSLAKIAELLNDAGRRAPRGGRWYPTSVSNLISRAERLLKTSESPCQI
ncbi:recombinase family protein [Comamonas odontotermitis]|uniref:recombinase family protein n=1 Tax=Comamonas odontotermitis TaxID=379895 RepID=UPI0036733EC7